MESTHALQPRLRITIPGLRRDIGLGSLVKKMTTALGLRPCGPCTQRAAALDGYLVLSAGECWRFSGRCTGFGSRQCVSGPEQQSPDALITTQCCSGWFQYPWIEVCPGQPATKGCGFCFW